MYFVMNDRLKLLLKEKNNVYNDDSLREEKYEFLASRRNIWVTPFLRETCHKHSVIDMWISFRKMIKIFFVLWRPIGWEAQIEGVIGSIFIVSIFISLICFGSIFIRSIFFGSIFIGTIFIGSIFQGWFLFGWFLLGWFSLA